MPELNWQKSSFSSEASNCLELATASDGTIHLRESDEPTVTLALQVPGLDSLLHAARRGIRTARDTGSTPKASAMSVPPKRPHSRTNLAAP
ncbi:DUF397 domain-containing protein [Streptomyces acidicola]|uniref:DUF397 domain-containing protein n=1 Tax=Streptomyces acidicola TaxID=2596892 RepID=A0A5N8WW65_9ACTN|nr:DUF397 domain-containing protein [Streptomyces acidicola]MPY51641.1 DUF397 domain-containing protein [Streptomyces acidicola]